MEEQQVGFLDVLCWGTAMIAPFLSFPGMVNRWRHRMLGQGDRRPEPTVAALACSLAWCYFGHINDQAEPFRLNALGALLQALYLVTFLCLCTPEERKQAFLPIFTAVCYLYTTFLIPYADADGLKSMCTLAGLVSAAAPLLTFAFLIQNGVGAVCSFVLLLLAWYWPPDPTAQDRDAWGNLINTDLVGVAAAAGPPAPEPTQTQGVIRNRKTAATDDEARAVLINPALVAVAKAAGSTSAPPAPTQTHSHYINIHELERIAAEAQARRDLVMDLNQDLVAVVAGKQHEE